jgi:DNA-binding response OmpR family regulator
MRRRILLVDDEVAVLLTLKAVLEISGFDVDTAASGREGVSRLHTREYHMLITDMRMESDAAGIEVIQAARNATYQPAIALLTAFPVADEDWQEMGADKLLVKPMHTRILLEQIENLIDSHERKLGRATDEISKVPKGIRAAASISSAPKRLPAAKEATTKPAKKVAKKIPSTAAKKKTLPRPVVNKSAVKTARKPAAKLVKKSAKKAARRTGRKA